MSTKVVLCTCGKTLDQKIDYEALADYAKTLEGVKSVSTLHALCTAGDKSKLVKALKGVERLVVLACTRSVCAKPIENALHEAKLEKDKYVLVNAKEQIASVHSDKSEATGKAKICFNGAY